MAVNNPWTWGLGRRKTAIARVRLKPGAGGTTYDDWRRRQEAKAQRRSEEAKGRGEAYPVAGR